MARNTRSVVVRDFSGGLNLRRDQFNLAANEFPFACNVELDGRGGLMARQDWKFAGPATARSIAAAFTAKPFISSGGRQVITCAKIPDSWMAQMSSYSTAGAIYYHPITTVSSEPCLTQTSMGITSDRIVGGVGMAIFNEIAYLARGHENVGYKWTGSAAVALTASATGQWQDSFASPSGTHMPKAEHVATHVGSLWVAATKENSTEYPSRVRWSHPGFPESWREDDYFDVPGGGYIRGLVPFGDMLVILKEDSLWAVLGYDEDSYQLVNLSESVGCSNERHAVVAGSTLFFLSWPEGVMSYTTEDGINKISDQIGVIFKREFVNSFAWAWASLHWSGGKLRFSVNVINDETIEPSMTNPFGFSNAQSVTSAWPSCTFVWDGNAWVLHHGCMINPALITGYGMMNSFDVLTELGNERAVGMARNSSYLFWVYIDSGTYLGDDTITAVGAETYTTTDPLKIIRTGWIDAGNQSWKKRWGRPEVLVREANGSLAFTYSTYRDWDESTQVRTGTMTLTGNDVTGALQGRLGLLGSSKAVQLKLTLPANFETGLLQIDFRYTPRQR